MADTSSTAVTNCPKHLKVINAELIYGWQTQVETKDRLGIADPLDNLPVRLDATEEVLCVVVCVCVCVRERERERDRERERFSAEVSAEPELSETGFQQDF